MRQQVTSRFIQLLFCFCLVETCSAQVRLTLQEALNEATQVNPQLTAARARLDEARGQRTQAGLAPNPRFVVQAEDYRFWGSQPHAFADTTEDYAYLGQTFETDRKRAKRVEVASSVVRQTETEQDLLIRQIRTHVISAYWNAAGATRIRNLLQENLKTYDEDVIYNRNRVHEGVMAETDLMRLELERDRVRLQGITAARDADEAVIELYRSIGRADFPTVVLLDSLDNIPAVTLPDMKQIFGARPELQVSRELVTEAQSNIRLQKANAKPDPEVFLGYKRELQLNTLYGAVQVDLPIRNRNQGAIASSEAQLRLNQANLATTEINIKAEVASAERAYRNALEIFQAFPTTRTRAEEVERLARAAYREGGIDLIRLLDAERSRIEVETEYARALVDLQQRIVTLQLAIGGDVNALAGKTR